MLAPTNAPELSAFLKTSYKNVTGKDWDFGQYVIGRIGPTRIVAAFASGSTPPGSEKLLLDVFLLTSNVLWNFSVYSFGPVRWHIASAKQVVQVDLEVASNIVVGRILSSSGSSFTMADDLDHESDLDAFLRSVAQIVWGP